VSVTAARDGNAGPAPFVPANRNAAHCADCLRLVAAGEPLWLVSKIRTLRLWSGETHTRDRAGTETFCESCAAAHVEEFNQVWWVTFNNGRFPVESTCLVCKRPMFLYDRHYGHSCNCRELAEPYEVGPGMFGGTKCDCRRCGNFWGFTEPSRRTGVRWGWEQTHCSERCRKAQYRKPTEREPTTCEVCEEEFTPKRADARYCSNACRQDAYRKRKLGTIA
jgi:hypothetical protein